MNSCKAVAVGLGQTLSYHNWERPCQTEDVFLHEKYTVAVEAIVSIKFNIDSTDCVTHRRVFSILEQKENFFGGHTSKTEKQKTSENFLK